MAVVSHQLQASLHRVDVLLLHNAAKSIAHDGDEHVQHRQRRHKSRSQEEKVANSRLRIVSEVVVIELSEGQHVLVEQHIEAPEAEVRVDKLIVTLCIPVEIEHVHGHSKGHQRDKQEDQEGKNVAKCLTNEMHIEGCTFKQAQPIEDLDEDKAACEGCDNPQ